MFPDVKEKLFLFQCKPKKISFETKKQKKMNDKRWETKFKPKTTTAVENGRKNRKS